MEANDLMLGDWLMLGQTGMYVKVCSVRPGFVEGVTAMGSEFSLPSDRLRGIGLDRDVLLRTDFWNVRREHFRKAVRGRATFDYDIVTHRLEVRLSNGSVNLHSVLFLHRLQHLYRHYSGTELFVTPLENKSKAYSRAYYHDRKQKGLQELGI